MCYYLLANLNTQIFYHQCPYSKPDHATDAMSVPVGELMYYNYPGTYYQNA